MAMPAAAEAGKLFDFNLTLPIMAGEILLLMVFLEKFWFTPVGKVSSSGGYDAVQAVHWGLADVLEHLHVGVRQSRNWGRHMQLDVAAAVLQGPSLSNKLQKAKPFGSCCHLAPQQQ